jgi:hypothetical protein
MFRRDEKSVLITGSYRMIYKFSIWRIRHANLLYRVLRHL